MYLDPSAVFTELTSGHSFYRLFFRTTGSTGVFRGSLGNGLLKIFWHLNVISKASNRVVADLVRSREALLLCLFYAENYFYC